MHSFSVVFMFAGLAYYLSGIGQDKTQTKACQRRIHVTETKQDKDARAEIDSSTKEGEPNTYPPIGNLYVC